MNQDRLNNLDFHAIHYTTTGLEEINYYDDPFNISQIIFSSIDVNKFFQIMDNVKKSKIIDKFGINENIPNHHIINNIINELIFWSNFYMNTKNAMKNRNEIIGILANIIYNKTDNIYKLLRLMRQKRHNNKEAFNGPYVIISTKIHLNILEFMNNHDIKMKIEIEGVIYRIYDMEI